MRLAQWMLIAAMAGGALVLAGCGSKVKHGSPKELLESFDKAVTAKDVDAAADCVPPDYQKSTKTMLTALKKIEDKNKAVKKTVDSKLGKETAEKVFGKEDSEDESPLRKAKKDGKIDWNLIKINEKGDEATVEIDGRAVSSLNMVKIDGKWYVKPGNEKPEDIAKMAEKAGKHADAQVKALSDFEKAVNDGKVTKDNAQQEYFKILGEAMKGMSED